LILESICILLQPWLFSEEHNVTGVALFYVLFCPQGNSIQTASALLHVYGQDDPLFQWC